MSPPLRLFSSVQNRWRDFGDLAASLKGMIIYAGVIRFIEAFSSLGQLADRAKRLTLF